MPRRIAIVMALMMMAVAGFAQIPTAGNVFAGATANSAASGWGKAGNLSGWEVSVEGKVAPYVGIVGDLGQEYGWLQTPGQYLFGGTATVPTHTRIVTILAGPRVSVNVGRFRPFAQALIGAAHLHQNLQQYAAAYSYGETSVGDAVGGGVDYRLQRFVGLRAQGDLVQTRFRGSRQNDFRFAIGVVLKF